MRTVREALVPSGSVKDRAVKSGIWATLLNVFERLIQITKLVILARLLDPVHFGLMGIALLVLAVYKRFSNLGIEAALIQRREEDIDELLNTAWIMHLTRGLIIAVVGFISAGFVASVFNEPRVDTVLRVLSIAPLIASLRNPGIVYFKKDLEFHKEFALRMSRTSVDFTVAVVLGFLYHNVWALVFGKLAADLVRLALSYRIHEYRPSIEFDFAVARNLFGYGKWLTIVGILVFLLHEGDDAFVGWFLGATALGFYRYGYQLSNAPATELTQVVSRVLFPTFSKMQDETRRLTNAYFRTTLLTMSIAFPAAVGIVFVAPVFVRVFLGEQWVPMIAAMQVLAAFGLVRAFGATAAPLLQAIGRPDYNAKFEAGKLLIMLVLIYPATGRWGITGTAVAVLGSAVFVEPVLNYFVVRRFLDGDARELFRLLLLPALGCLFMTPAVWFLRETVVDVPGPLRFLLLIAAGAAVYIATVAVLDRQFEFGLEDDILNIAGSLR